MNQMMMYNKFTTRSVVTKVIIVLFFIILTLFSGIENDAIASEIEKKASQPVPENKAGSWNAGTKWLTNPFREMLKPVNQAGIGKFSGQIQFLVMRRTWDGAKNMEASSGTVAATIRYRSPEFSGISGGLEYIFTPKLFEGSSGEARQGGGWQTLNDDFHVLSEAFIDVKLGFIGLEKSSIRIGRQKCNYDFAPAIPIRQKSQYMEAVVLKLYDIDHFKIDIGHIEKFSSWSGRMGQGDWLQANFNSVEDIIADYEGDNRIRSADTGMQFVQVGTDIIPFVNLTAYDLFGFDLYNTFGVKAYVNLVKNDDWSLTWKNHYISQRDVGSYPIEVSSDAIESSLAFKSGDLTLEPGIMKVFGDNESANDLRHPFESSLMWEYILMWNTRANLGGSDTVFMKSTYTLDNHFFYLLGMATYHEDDVRNGSTDYELDAIYRYKFTEDISTTIKFGYGFRNPEDGDSLKRTDLRLFITYKF